MNSLSSKKKQKRKKAEVYKVSSIDNYILLYYSCHFLNPVCVIIWDIFINIYIKFNFSMICKLLLYCWFHIHVHSLSIFKIYNMNDFPCMTSAVEWNGVGWWWLGRGGGVEFNEWKITHTSMFKYITAVVLLMLMWE